MGVARALQVGGFFAPIFSILQTMFSGRRCFQTLIRDECRRNYRYIIGLGVIKKIEGKALPTFFSEISSASSR